MEPERGLRRERRRAPDGSYRLATLVGMFPWKIS